MDNFIDSFLSSPPWSNTNASASRAWVRNITSQTYEDGKSPALQTAPSNIIRTLSAEDLNLDHNKTSSIFTDRSLKYDVSKGFFLGSRNLSQNLQPKQKLQSSHYIDAREGYFSMESNGCELLTFGQSVGEANTISSVPVTWPPSYSVISPSTGKDKLECLSFQSIPNGADLLRIDEDEHSPNLVTYSNGYQGTTELQNLQLPSFSSGSQISFSETVSMQTHQKYEGIAIKHQMSHSTSTHQPMTQTDGNGCNLPAKPRVRARRGQATDPHRISERLRRERIAERMKNWQELVPNSNKNDKASMLDEIIDYVKFLQLQVKVLSVSRFGTSNAIVPLISDVHTEVNGRLNLSPNSKGVDPLMVPPETLAFEQEVVKLMESNITAAMQYLQNKGLCLMPTALATAISHQKGSLASFSPDQRRLPDSSQSNGIVIKQEEPTKPMGNGR